MVRLAIRRWSVTVWTITYPALWLPTKVTQLTSISTPIPAWDAISSSLPPQPRYEQLPVFSIALLELFAGAR